MVKTILLMALYFTILNNVLLAQPNKKSTLPDVAQLFIGKWEGEGKTPEGEAFKSQLLFNWTLDSNFIEVKNNINTNGKPEQYAVTIYGWQPVIGRISFWSFDREGTINEGLAELEDNELKHEWRSFGKGGEIKEWRSILKKNDSTTLIFTVYDNRNFELMSVTYKKQ